jgi:hypothetical protein
VVNTVCPRYRYRAVVLPSFDQPLDTVATVDRPRQSAQSLAKSLLLVDWIISFMKGSIPVAAPALTGIGSRVQADSQP